MSAALDPALIDAVQRAGLLAALLLAPVAVAVFVAGALSGVVAAFTGWPESAIGHALRLTLVGAAWALSFGHIAREVQALATLAWGGG
jgi:type III secretory pathway component EscS